MCSAPQGTKGASSDPSVQSQSSVPQLVTTGGQSRDDPEVASTVQAHTTRRFIRHWRLAVISVATAIVTIGGAVSYLNGGITWLLGRTHPAPTASYVIEGPEGQGRVQEGSIRSFTPAAKGGVLIRRLSADGTSLESRIFDDPIAGACTIPSDKDRPQRCLVALYDPSPDRMLDEENPVKLSYFDQEQGVLFDAAESANEVFPPNASRKLHGKWSIANVTTGNVLGRDYIFVAISDSVAPFALAILDKDLAPVYWLWHPGRIDPIFAITESTSGIPYLFIIGKNNSLNPITDADLSTVKKPHRVFMAVFDCERLITRARYSAEAPLVSTMPPSEQMSYLLELRDKHGRGFALTVMYDQVKRWYLQMRSHGLIDYWVFEDPRIKLVHEETHAVHSQRVEVLAWLPENDGDEPHASREVRFTYWEEDGTWDFDSVYMGFQTEGEKLPPEFRPADPVDLLKLCEERLSAWRSRASTDN